MDDLPDTYLPDDRWQRLARSIATASSIDDEAARWILVDQRIWPESSKD